MLSSSWRKLCSKIKNFDIKPSKPIVAEKLSTALQLHEQGKVCEALNAFREVLAVSYDNEDALYYYGMLNNEIGNYKIAERAYKVGLREHPSKPLFYRLLGSLYATHNKLKKSRALYKRANKISTTPSSEYLYKAVSGQHVDCAPGEYVKFVFDDYASRFEEMLIELLGYQAPEALIFYILKEAGKFDDEIEVLDLGCGTGLFGTNFKKNCKFKSLIGVDLSSGMLKECNKKNIYTDLIEQDINSYLQTTEKKFDLIASSDVFIYLGNLEKTIKYSYEALKPGGWLAFTVEKLDNQDGFKLNHTGRFSHSTEYINMLYRKNEFTKLVIEEIDLRYELGKPALGYAVLLQK